MGKTPDNYWKKRSEMTPEDLGAARAYDRAMRLKHLSARRERNRNWYRSKTEDEKKQIASRVSDKRRERKANATPEQWAAMQAVWKDVRVRMKNAMRGRLRDKIKSAFMKRISMSAVVSKSSVERVLSRVRPGMSEENFGSVWHLDHVVPCAWFDLTKASHQEACVHDSNVRPEFASVNASRSFAVSAEHFEWVLDRCPVRLQHVYEEIRSKIRRREFPERMLRRVSFPL